MSDPFARFRRFLRELKRRKVYRVAVTYAVVAAGAVQLVSVVIPASRLPAWSDEFFLALAVFGFPIAVVLAWAFEVTPEGVRRTETVEEAGSEVGAYQWVGLTVVVLLAGGVWYAMTGDGGKEPAQKTAAATDTVQAEFTVSDRSIAVLPFDNLSGTEDAEPFVNGLHDDLLTRLSNVSELKVISRTSVLPYRETQLSLPAIADRLGVTWIVEGGVQQAGDQVQVNAQLIQAEEDAHRWAETYQRKLTTENLFAVQSELTKKIVRSLEAELTPEEVERVERRPTGDLEAYRLYVQGRHLLGKRTGPSIREAIDYFQRAIRKDSSYALAWAGLADARGLYPAHGTGSLSDSIPAHETAARRALELGSDLAEAHASMGFVHFHQQNGLAALRELRRAVQLKPSYFQAQHWLAWVLLNLGRLEEAQEHGTLAVRLNPRQPAPRDVTVAMLVADGQAEKAKPHVQAMGDTEPVYRGLYLYHTRRWKPLKSLARQLLQTQDAQRPIWRFYLARVALLHGDTAAARSQLAEMGQEGDHFEEGLVHAALGEAEAALKAWQRIERWGGVVGPSLPVLYSSWYADILEPLRDDPRFRRLVQRRNRAWGLNPDGSLPDSVDVTFEAPTDD